jgi:hypothetical protein
LRETCGGVHRDSDELNIIEPPLLESEVNFLGAVKVIR